MERYTAKKMDIQWLKMNQKKELQKKELGRIEEKNEVNFKNITWHTN